MCQPKNAEHIIAQRRREVSELYLTGWSQEEIAEHLNVSQPTIHRDIRAIQDQWREESIASQTMLRDKEARKLDMIERAAWEGWKRSLKPGADGETQDPIGDPRFLSLIHKCGVQRRSLLGLDAIPKEEREKTLGECTDEEFDAMLDKLRQDIEARVDEQESLNAALEEERSEQETKGQPVPANEGSRPIVDASSSVRNDEPKSSGKPEKKSGVAPSANASTGEISGRHDGQECPSSTRLDRSQSRAGERNSQGRPTSG